MYTKMLSVHGSSVRTVLKAEMCIKEVKFNSAKPTVIE